MTVTVEVAASIEVLPIGVAVDMLLVILVLNVDVLPGAASVVPTAGLAPVSEMQLPVQNGDAA